MGSIASLGKIAWKWAGHISLAQWLWSLGGGILMGMLAWIGEQQLWLVGFVALGSFAFISIIWSNVRVRRSPGPAVDSREATYCTSSSDDEKKCAMSGAATERSGIEITNGQNGIFDRNLFEVGDIDRIDNEGKMRDNEFKKASGP